MLGNWADWPGGGIYVQRQQLRTAQESLPWSIFSCRSTRNICCRGTSVSVLTTVRVRHMWFVFQQGRDVFRQRHSTHGIFLLLLYHSLLLLSVGFQQPFPILIHILGKSSHFWYLSSSLPCQSFHIFFPFYSRSTFSSSTGYLSYPKYPDLLWVQKPS